MVAMPKDTPVTIPDTAPTVAIAVLPLVHTPPETELLKGTVEPLHTSILPDIAGSTGTAKTVSL